MWSVKFSLVVFLVLFDTDDVLLKKERNPLSLVLDWYEMFFGLAFMSHTQHFN